MWRIILLLIATVLSMTTSWWYGFGNLRAQLSAIAQQSSEEWDLIDLPRSTWRAGLFDRAYEHAKSELYIPTVQALDQVYAIIWDRCDYKDIEIDDISKIFSQTQVWRELKNLTRLHTQNVVSITEGKTFSDACINIVWCYHQEELQQRKIERDDFTLYTTQTRQSCTSIVTSLYSTTYQVAASHETIKSKNYGEAIFTNGVKQDAPYDLMLDIEEIANHLFRQNTTVTPIEVYNLPDGIWTSDIPESGEVIIDEPIDPNDLEREERYTPTQWVPPAIPDEVWWVYPYSNIPSEVLQSDLPPGLCLAEAPYQWEIDEPTYEEEVEQGEDVQESLDNLWLTDFELSVLIAERYTREQEEALWDGDPENDPDALETQDNLDAFEEDLDWDTLEQIKEHVQWCIDEFTDHNNDARRKTLRKSITQPTKFTQCVFAWLCKEVSDSSWLWIYTVKICKEPRKWWWVVGSQSVKSVEEIIDTMNTTCRSLQESWQLLKHNKTKDHWEHRLMNIKLWEMFSFGLSVVFDEPETVRNLAWEKTEQIQNNSILEDRLLGITQKMTSIWQRNKYMIINDILEDASVQWYNGKQSDIQKENEAAQRKRQNFDDAKSFARNAQQLWKIQTTEYLIGFLEDNITFWRVANDYTQSLQKTREAAASDFK